MGVMRAILPHLPPHYPGAVTESAGPAENPAAAHPLEALLGGWRGALESILPPAAFVITFLTTNSIGWAVGVALGLAVLFAVWRMAQGKRPTRAVSALLVVAVSAYVAVTFDSAVAFFWPRVLINLVSALAFAVSILVRWPLLGVIVGPIVGTKMQWRQDPALMRAYSRASWLWVALCLIRAAVLVPLIEQQLWWGLAVTGLIFYGLVIATVLLSWVLIRGALPEGHPGIRTPVLPPAQ
jgi:hypothetical protein